MGTLTLESECESGGLTVPSLGEIQCWLFYETSVLAPPESLMHRGSRNSVSSGSDDVRSGAPNCARDRDWWAPWALGVSSTHSLMITIFHVACNKMFQEKKKKRHQGNYKLWKSYVWLYRPQSKPAQTMKCLTLGLKKISISLHILVFSNSCSFVKWGLFYGLLMCLKII